MSKAPFPRAVGGGPLRGRKLSKYLYLDESGIGDIRRERTVVVAGVLLDTDTQWRRAAKRLQDISVARLGKSRRKAFHAKELFHGGKEFKRASIEEVGWPILKDLVCVPRDLKLVVVWGKAERAAVRDRHPKLSVEQQTQRAYQIAFSVCLLKAEEWMRRYADEQEVATVVIEDNHRMKKHVRQAFDYLRSPNWAKLTAERGGLARPIRYLIDTPHSVAKDDAPLLQIADACAYSIRRRLAGEWMSDHFFDCLQVEMYPRPKASLLPAVPARRA